MNITDDQIEEIGLLRDRCENLLAASQIPFPAAIHIEGLTGGLKEIQKRLESLHSQLQTP